MRFFLLLTVLIVLVTTGATEAGAYLAIGSGIDSCGSWTANRPAYTPGGLATQSFQNALQDQAWVLGFLSGIGFVAKNGADPLDGVDAEGVWAWIDNYCRAHPIEVLGQAAAAFYYAHPHR
jgi:hypothetical protein